MDGQAGVQPAFSGQVAELCGGPERGACLALRGDACGQSGLDVTVCAEAGPGAEPFFQGGRGDDG